MAFPPQRNNLTYMPMPMLIPMLMLIPPPEPVWVSSRTTPCSFTFGATYFFFAVFCSICYLRLERYVCGYLQIKCKTNLRTGTYQFPRQQRFLLQERGFDSTSNLSGVTAASALVFSRSHSIIVEGVSASSQLPVQEDHTPKYTHVMNFNQNDEENS